MTFIIKLSSLDNTSTERKLLNRFFYVIKSLATNFAALFLRKLHYNIYEHHTLYYIKFEIAFWCVFKKVVSINVFHSSKKDAWVANFRFLVDSLELRLLQFPLHSGKSPCMAFECHFY